MSQDEDDFGPGVSGLLPLRSGRPLRGGWCRSLWEGCSQVGTVCQHLQTRRGRTLCGLWRALYPDLLQPVAVGGCGGLNLLLSWSELGRPGLGRPGLGSAGPAGSAVRADGVEGSAVDDLLEGGGGGAALLPANWLPGGVAVLGWAAGDRVLVALHVPCQAARTSF